VTNSAAIQDECKEIRRFTMTSTDCVLAITDLQTIGLAKQLTKRRLVSRRRC